MNKQWIYSKRPEGEVTEEHYKLVETPIPEPKDGEILIKALYISVDPYMRIQQSATNSWAAPHPLNVVQQGGVVGEVIKSNYSEIKVGDIVNTSGGWQTYAVVKGTSARVIDPKKAPISYALGILGMPGRTAYFGLLEYGKPQPGETCVVSGAAGAVGSIVVQIAKIKGCRVVGIVGSKEKEDYLKSLGVDETINYKHFKTLPEMKAALEKVCPKGIDIYFDNTGGVIADAVFQLINVRARILICGQITQYSGRLDEPELGPRFLHRILYTRATIQGFLASDFINRQPEMLEEMTKWLEEKKIRYDETVIEGFENLPKALNSLFHGTNTGKLLVKI